MDAPDTTMKIEMEEYLGLIELAKAVKRMRDFQGLYFKTRAREVLYKCKRYEREVDDLIRKHLPATKGKPDESNDSSRSD